MPIPEPPPLPRAWPILLALGGVVLLAISMLGVDLVVARRTGHKTAELVGNSQRGVELVDDLREQSHRLVDPALTAQELIQVSRRVSDDARAYDPLATSPGEHEEWSELQQLLAALQVDIDRKDTPAISITAKRIGASIDRLVKINRDSAHAQADAINGVHWKAMVADASFGALTIALVVLIVVVTLRLLARQRTLNAQYIALLAERNRELDAFAERAAHDMRAPLNPIRGYADLLLAGNEPPDEVHRMASRIRAAVDRLARVVDDMLELSRAGRPSSGRASPSDVAGAVLEELGPELKDARVTTELTDAEVACAPGVLAQILRNLVGNAIKFRSRQRPLEVSLEARAVDMHIELAVGDNGMGMDEEAAQHAFEPHYRAASVRETPGHGLGLAIVERATRVLGGTCTLSSAPDRGTRIVVVLPRAR